MSSTQEFDREGREDVRLFAKPATEREALLQAALGLARTELAKVTPQRDAMLVVLQQLAALKRIRVQAFGPHDQLIVPAPLMQLLDDIVKLQP
jgi:hypothetical protein